MCSKYISPHIIHIYAIVHMHIMYTYICIQYIHINAYHVYAYAYNIYTYISFLCVCVCIVYIHTTHSYTSLHRSRPYIYEMLPPYQVVSNSRARITSSLIYFLELSHRECSVLFPAGTIPSCKHCFHIICILTQFNLLLSF